MADSFSGSGAGNAWGVHGADFAVRALQTALSRGSLAHAYLFGGPDGVGKRTLATRLAQAVLCTAPRNDAGGTEGHSGNPGGGVRGPCRECRTCTLVESGDSPDVEFVGIGGVCDVSNHDHSGDNSTRIRICQVRRIERLSALAPFSASRRVFIVQNANDLQTEAGHALLKTLEEPPSTALILLLATDVDALLPTVRSRCQEFALRPLPSLRLAALLEAEREVPSADAARLARAASGCFGLAVRMYQDPSHAMLSSSARADIAHLLGAGRNERLDYAATLAGRWQRERASVLEVLAHWQSWFRDALRASCDLSPEPSVDDATESDGSSAPIEMEAAEAVGALQASRRAVQRLLENTNPQLVLEVLMLDLPLADNTIRKEARPAAVS